MKNALPVFLSLIFGVPTVAAIGNSDTAEPATRAITTVTPASAETVNSTDTMTPAPTPETEPAHLPEPVKQIDNPEPVPVPTPTVAAPSPTVTYYANCSAVRAAGAAPILTGEPGYSSKLDRDGDSIACET